MNNMRKNIEKRGWWKGSCCEQDLDTFLLDIANALGVPVGMRQKRKLIEILKPITSGFAHPNSLSKQFALSEFPVHCDTAHWPTPCRYVVLGCKDKGSCGRQTILIDWKSKIFKKAELQLLKSAVFLVKDGRKSFYSSIIHKNELFARYDLGCIFPASNDASLALELFKSVIDRADRYEISWTKDDVVVIDNWRILHGRGMASQSSILNSTRELHRILVE